MPRLATYSDTSSDIESLILDLQRKMPAWKKIELVRSLNDMTLKLSSAGLRKRYPQASDAELKRRMADIILGPELAERVYGSLTDIEA